MRKVSVFLPFLLLAAIIAWVAYSFWQASSPKPMILQGQIEAQQYSVSSKIAGRIDEVYVRKGDTVKPGQPIFSLVSPELSAKLTQAQAGQQAASAMAKDAAIGAREQEIAAARDQWQQAQSAATLAQKTYQRINNLFVEGVISEQKRDEAYTQWQVAKHRENAAEQKFNLTQEGTRKETIVAAVEQEKAAAGKVAEVEAYTQETKVSAYHSGEVSQVLLHNGELAPSGFPVVSIIDMNDAWLVLNIREDQLAAFKKGNEFDARIPALDNRKVTFKVSFLSVMGDFATWRATNSTRGFDMRTFEVEARPVTPVADLRVGMSAIVEQAN